MSNNSDWFPGTRKAQIELAQDWIVILLAKTLSENVPDAMVTELQRLLGIADAALKAAALSDRTAVTTANCKAAFDALSAQMRYIKSHYFLSPPLTDANLIALKLKPRDETHTPVPAPTSQATADVSLSGIHLLELHFHPTANSEPDPRLNDYGYRYYWGVMPPGGASVEDATGIKRELMNVPTAGALLPFSKFTRRKKELIDFAEGDSGKKAFFCVRYENAKGEPGPWGPVFSAVIP